MIIYKKIKPIKIKQTLKAYFFFSDVSSTPHYLCHYKCQGNLTARVHSANECFILQSSLVASTQTLVPFYPLLSTSTNRPFFPLSAVPLSSKNSGWHAFCFTGRGNHGFFTCTKLEDTLYFKRLVLLSSASSI